MAKVRLLVLPYGNAQTRTLVELLVIELNSGRWSRFAAAVAFARQSANYVEFLDALEKFAAAGNRIDLTFGANTFGAESAGSESEAVESVLKRLPYANARVHLYREATRTFHPKVYLFDNEKANAALLIVGSSNWTDGGLRNNVEANVIVELDLVQADDLRIFQETHAFFEDYWQEQEGKP